MTLLNQIWQDDSHLENIAYRNEPFVNFNSFKIALFNFVSLQCSVLLSWCQNNMFYPNYSMVWKKLHKIDYCLYMFQYIDLVKLKQNKSHLCLSILWAVG